MSNDKAAYSAQFDSTAFILSGQLYVVLKVVATLPSGTFVDTKLVQIINVPSPIQVKFLLSNRYISLLLRVHRARIYH
jgi:hypothetical protein